MSVDYINVLSNGKIVEQGSYNDLLNSEYKNNIVIFKIKNNYAYIHASCVINNISSIEKEGWIKLEYLGINPANCSNGLILRKRPSNNAKVKRNILNPSWGDLYPIKKAHRGWLYIETIINNIQYKLKNQ